VSKDDLKMHGRALGKLSHSDPTLLWSIALRQIQSYENLVKPVVESARFVTPLGADVVVYVLLDDFSNPTKDRTKTDGTSVSLWLKSASLLPSYTWLCRALADLFARSPVLLPGLAAFAGELCRRHIDKIDCKPIVRYIANQLKAGNSKDLIILREIVSAMTGIDPLANLSDNQVASLSGGPTLQAEAIHPTVASSKPPPQPGVEVRAEAPVEKRGLTTKSSLLLLKSLEEERMLVPLLVVVAQARDTCVITVPEAEAHMKHLSSLFDSVSFQL
jgi:THO complex subunit 2